MLEGKIPGSRPLSTSERQNLDEEECQYDQYVDELDIETMKQAMK
jgi:hypothetical protein